MVDTIAPSVMPLVIIEIINSQRDGHFLSLRVHARTSRRPPSHALNKIEKEEPASHHLCREDRKLISKLLVIRKYYYL
jgi:hypothetical protein